MTICLFEDQFSANLLPLVHCRPVYELKTGAFTLWERIINHYPKTKFSLHCRPQLTNVLKAKYGDLSINKLKQDDYLFINGRVVADQKFAQKVKIKGPDCCWRKGRQLIAARVSREKAKKLDLKDNLAKQLSKLPCKKIAVETVLNLWDLIRFQEKLLEKDIEKMIKGKRLASHYREGVFAVNPKKIFIDRNCQIQPGAVLDASQGPIYIEEGVSIGANSVLTGPVYLGYETIIQPLSRINRHTYIGPVCKIGGEVSESIIQSFSNKQHAGHLGHAYLGSWCNLGAGTDNSDLKNNYSSIKVWTNQKLVDSKIIFLGLFMGDHSKTGIGTKINTGTVIGFSANVFGSSLSPKAIPSFAWADLDGRSTEYDLAKAQKTAKKAMERRGEKLTAAWQKLFQQIYQDTKAERQLLIKKINEK